MLEPAPLTSLRPARTSGAGTGRWEGFWSVEDDRYYTRCTQPDGRVTWYAIRDDAVAAIVRVTARVIPLRRRAAPVVFVSSRRHRAPVLVGVSPRRTVRPRPGDRS